MKTSFIFKTTGLYFLAKQAILSSHKYLFLLLTTITISSNLYLKLSNCWKLYSRVLLSSFSSVPTNCYKYNSQISSFKSSYICTSNTSQVNSFLFVSTSIIQEISSLNYSANFLRFNENLKSYPSF